MKCREWGVGGGGEGGCGEGKGEAVCVNDALAWRHWQRKRGAKIMFYSSVLTLA